MKWLERLFGPRLPPPAAPDRDPDLNGYRRQSDRILAESRRVNDRVRRELEAIERRRG